MNELDIILALPLLWGAYRGFRNGLVYEILIVIVLIAGVYGGHQLVNYVTEYVETNYNYHSKMLPFYCFIGILILLMVVVYFITKASNKLLDFFGLGIINKIAGALIGVVKWAFFISLLFYLIAPFDSNNKIIPKDKKEDSFLYEPISQFTLLIVPSMTVITKEIKGQVDKVKKSKR
jgi:membrane protein required for colicin V production